MLPFRPWQLGRREIRVEIFNGVLGGEGIENNIELLFLQNRHMFFGVGEIL